MPLSVCVPEPMRSDFSAFLIKENIPLAVISGDTGDVVITPSEGERRECDTSTLYQGGWIPCATARTAAEHLSLEYGEFGKVLNYLDIKIRECELGCF
jgi:hypothetical protein